MCYIIYTKSKFVENGNKFYNNFWYLNKTFCSFFLNTERACQNNTLGSKLVSKLQQENVKLEFSNDIIGVQICAALNNVFALVCGIIFCRKLGFKMFHAAGGVDYKKYE